MGGRSRGESNRFRTSMALLCVCVRVCVLQSLRRYGSACPCACTYDSVCACVHARASVSARDAVSCACARIWVHAVTAC